MILILTHQLLCPLERLRIEGEIIWVEAILRFEVRSFQRLAWNLVYVMRYVRLAQIPCPHRAAVGLMPGSESVMPAQVMIGAEVLALLTSFHACGVQLVNALDRKYSPFSVYPLISCKSQELILNFTISK